MLERILVPQRISLQAAFNLDPQEVDPTIEVMGFDLPDPLPADSNDPRAPYIAFLRSAVPAIDPLYEFRKELVRDIYYWWQSGEDVLVLFGPTGSGKTSLLEQWCARLGVPLFAGKGHRGFEPHEAFGHYVAGQGGQTEWAPGPVTLAAQYGCPVIINEYDRIQPSRAIVFNDVFEKRAFPVPGKHGEIIVPRPGFRCAVTANTNLVEDPSGNYATAASHDVSMLERFYAVHVDYDPEMERRLLERLLEPYDDKLLAYWFDQEGMKLQTATGMKVGSAISRAEFIAGLQEVARKIRSQSKDGGNADDAALERTMSTRILRKWAKHSVQHCSAPERQGKSGMHIALRKYLSGLATESTRIALHQAVETVFGVGEDVSAQP